MTKKGYMVVKLDLVIIFIYDIFISSTKVITYAGFSKWNQSDIKVIAQRTGFDWLQLFFEKANSITA